MPNPEITGRARREAFILFGPKHTKLGYPQVIDLGPQPSFEEVELHLLMFGLDVE